MSPGAEIFFDVRNWISTIEQCMQFEGFDMVFKSQTVQEALSARPSTAISSSSNKVGSALQHADPLNRYPR